MHNATADAMHPLIVPTPGSRAVLHVDRISKSFALYDRPSDRLKEVLLRRSYHSMHRAVSDISLSLHAGEVLGIAGRNGAGKSTLLKLIMGLLVPDTGSVTRAGKVTGLLELGTGFNVELTGFANIQFNGLLLGMSQAALDERRAAIVDFAELGEFIHHPIKVYSSGMVMRLAFAIAIHARPACMIIDEALAVGDAYFQQKCMRAIFRFRDEGGSIILVTHDMNAIRTLATRALLLEQGRAILSGDPREVADRYQALLVQDLHQGERPAQLTDSSADDLPVGAAGAEPEGVTATRPDPLVTTHEVSLVAIQLLDANERPRTEVVSESIVRIVCEVLSHRDLDDAHFGFFIRNQYGQTVFETNTHCMRKPGVRIPANQVTSLRFTFVCNLSHGNYSFSLGVSNKGIGDANFEEYLLLAHDVLVFQVLTNTDAIVYAGVTNLNPSVEVDVRPSNGAPSHSAVTLAHASETNART